MCLHARTRACVLTQIHASNGHVLQGRVDAARASAVEEGEESRAKAAAASMTLAGDIHAHRHTHTHAHTHKNTQTHTHTHTHTTVTSLTGDVAAIESSVRALKESLAAKMHDANRLISANDLRAREALEQVGGQFAVAIDSAQSTLALNTQVMSDL